MSDFRLSPSAHSDLENIVTFIREAAGADIARDLIEKIRNRCRLLADTPGTIGSDRDEIRVGVRSFPVSPYVLFFRYEDETVEIIRVLHEKQDLDRAFSEEDSSDS